MITPARAGPRSSHRHPEARPEGWGQQKGNFPGHLEDRCREEQDPTISNRFWCFWNLLDFAVLISLWCRVVVVWQSFCTTALGQAPPPSPAAGYCRTLQTPSAAPWHQDWKAGHLFNGNLYPPSHPPRIHIWSHLNQFIEKHLQELWLRSAWPWAFGLFHSHKA